MSKFEKDLLKTGMEGFKGCRWKWMKKWMKVEENMDDCR